MVTMDIVYLAIIIGLFALSFGFIALCERLMADQGGKR